MLRVLTLTISICLIIRGWRKVYDNLDQIAKEVGLTQPKIVIRHKHALQNRDKAGWIERILACFSTGAMFHMCVRKNSDEYFDVRLG
jgi:hypothetical protein